ncbi:MAG: thermonuclease family protein [Gudongella sp.]|nr:thermonuclease family protein [Gudongella sp.]
MKREFRGFITGLIISFLLISSVSFGDSFGETIQVLFNKVKIEVDGKEIEGNNILYDGVTYVPLREIAVLFDKQVDWDEKSNTAFVYNNKFERAIVIRPIDGDTIVVSLADGREEKVRFIGVDSPETVHPNKDIEFYGKEASEYTKSNLLGKNVYLEKDISETDIYGRLLRYVWIERPERVDEQMIRENMFNALLILDGYAQISTYPPDLKYLDYLTKFQTEAREYNKGLWSE